MLRAPRQLAMGVAQAALSRAMGSWRFRHSRQEAVPSRRRALSLGTGADWRCRAAEQASDPMSRTGSRRGARPGQRAFGRGGRPRGEFEAEIQESNEWNVLRENYLSRSVRFVSRLLRRRQLSRAAGETLPSMSAHKDSVGPRAALSVGLGEPSPDGTCDVPAKAPSARGIDSPFSTDALPSASANDILLVVHEFSRTGAPYAGLYLPRLVCPPGC